jgi:hypothetical protein
MDPWIQRFRFSRMQLFVQAEDRPHERSFDRRSSSTGTTSPALRWSAPDPRKRPRTRREKKDKPEVDDEQPDRKGCDEPYN